jgi:hypothetical protein
MSSCFGYDIAVADRGIQSVVGQSNTVALDFGRALLGPIGGTIFAFMVAFSCFGALNGAPDVHLMRSFPHLESSLVRVVLHVGAPYICRGPRTLSPLDVREAAPHAPDPAERDAAPGGDDHHVHCDRRRIPEVDQLCSGSELGFLLPYRACVVTSVEVGADSGVGSRTGEAAHARATTGKVADCVP